MNENVIEWLNGDATAKLTLTQGRFKNKIRRLREDNEDIRIIENTDGSMFAEIPLEYIKIGKPRRVDLTDEERAEIAERLKTSKMAKGEDDGE